MTTLTKEYFDKRLDGLQKDIQIDIHELAAMTANGFSDLEKRIDVRERVEKLEKKMATVETALNVHL